MTPNYRCRFAGAGGKVQRISMSFFYTLGAALRDASRIKQDMKLKEIWVELFTAERELNNLFGTTWFSPAIRTAYYPGQELLKAIQPLTQRSDFDTDLTVQEVWGISKALSDFETVLKTELSIVDAYFVTRKAGYDTTTLTMNGEQCFPADLATKVKNAIPDVKEAGKCLAFEVSTAAGFHVLRGTESVLRVYWDVASKGKPHPRQKNIGVYLDKMEKGNMGSAKVRAALKQIKDLHRNPLMHPEITLTLDEAIALFGICHSAITAMLAEIPAPPSVPALSSGSP